MITIKNVSKIYGEEFLLENINLTINQTDKIGIVGRNGVGKSTLLKIIENDEHATDGTVIFGKNTIGFLSQEKQLDNDNTLNDEIKLMQKEADDILSQMNVIINDVNFSTSESLIKEYGHLENKYDQLGGYEIESKIHKILGIFGFSKERFKQKIDDFSGGEKTRIALIKLILKEPDFLILDEPTNHLDVETIEWLEDYLRLKAKGVIVVSHDRFFLQRVCNKIVEIEHQKLEIYNTTYSNYINEKKLRYEFNLNSYLNQQDEIKSLQEFINKNNKKANKIGQVNDRKKKLENMVLLEKPRLISEKLNFEIDGFKLKKAHYVDMLNVDIGFDKPLIKDINFTIRGGDKIGIIGENGCGKSTLIKTMTRQIKPLCGNMILHPKIKIGYFEQEETSLNQEKTVYETVEELMQGESSTMIRKHLARFLFKKQDVFKKVSVLSGGEKVRLVFAQFVLKRYDMIILDEPTNHLDLSAKQELEEVLKQYMGTIIVISHDRYFINEVVNKIFYINDLNYYVYEGDYEQYLKFKSDSHSTKVKKIVSKKQDKKININLTKKLEKEILKVEQRKDEAIRLSTLEENYNDWEKINKINLEISSCELKLEELYDNLFLQEENND